MTQIKKQLTEVQFKTFIAAQLEYDQMKSAFEGLAARLDEVRNLILDAHGLELSTIDTMTLNAQTGELTVKLKEAAK